MKVLKLVFLFLLIVSGIYAQDDFPVYPETGDPETPFTEVVTRFNDEGVREFRLFNVDYDPDGTIKRLGWISSWANLNAYLQSLYNQGLQNLIDELKSLRAHSAWSAAQRDFNQLNLQIRELTKQEVNGDTTFATFYTLADTSWIGNKQNINLPSKVAPSRRFAGRDTTTTAGRFRLDHDLFATPGSYRVILADTTVELTDVIVNKAVFRATVVDKITREPKPQYDLIVRYVVEYPGYSSWTIIAPGGYRKHFMVNSENDRGVEIDNPITFTPSEGTDIVLFRPLVGQMFDVRSTSFLDGQWTPVVRSAGQYRIYPVDETNKVDGFLRTRNDGSSFLRQGYVLENTEYGLRMIQHHIIENDAQN